MNIILVGHRHPEVIARLSRAVQSANRRGFSGAIRIVDDITAIASVAADLSPAAVVFDPYLQSTLCFELWEGVRVAAPLAGLVAYADFRGRPVGHDIPLLSQAGIRIVVTFDVDDSQAELIRHLYSSIGTGVVSLLTEESTLRLSPPQRMVFRRALLGSSTVRTVEDLSRSVGASPRSLRRWLANLPQMTPVRLLTWVSVLQMSRLLSHTETPPGEISARLGLSGYGEYCRRYRRVVRESVSAIDRARLYAVALAAFDRALSSDTTENGTVNLARLEPQSSSV